MYLQVEVPLYTATYVANGAGRSLKVADPTCDAIACLLHVDSADLEQPGLLWVSLPVGYWRKANAIHAWFIRDQGEDDCKPFSVGLEELEDLDHICEKVLTSKADPETCEVLLPPQAGFFFGGTDLADPLTFEAYLDDVKSTREIIARCRRIVASIKERDGIAPDFEYHASW